MSSPLLKTDSRVPKFSDFVFSEASENNMALADKNMVSATVFGGGVCANVGNSPVAYAWRMTSFSTLSIGRAPLSSIIL